MGKVMSGESGGSGGGLSWKTLEIGVEGGGGW